ncbi:RMD1 family protein [Vineibacter terrae]|uniref:RMD1 family protein n=1 Tax=Vineibacter terrae TaxID=2586908 RepID=UPI002E3796F6|nr:RMD1 family protein [Vineibacter terrae]HEX2890685.1 RMD1 family protein [Vineibacter terrae]
MNTDNVSTASATKALPLPAGRSELTLKAILVGERIDTRGLGAASGATTTPVTLQPASGGIAFVFRYGVVVLVGIDAAAERVLLVSLRGRVVAPEEAPATEEARIVLGGEVNEAAVASETVVLQDATLEHLQVVASVLSKSVVLAHQETAIASALDRIEPFVFQLRDRGGVVTKGPALLRQIGHVLSAMQRMAVRVEAEDKPDLLWDYPQLERLYARLADEYEIVERSRALGRKLTLINESVTSLLQVVDTRRAVRLEWAIILLIAFEILLSLYDMFVRGAH